MNSNKWIKKQSSFDVLYPNSLKATVKHAPVWVTQKISGAVLNPAVVKDIPDDNTVVKVRPEILISKSKKQLTELAEKAERARYRSRFGIPFEERFIEPIKESNSECDYFSDNDDDYIEDECEEDNDS